MFSAISNVLNCRSDSFFPHLKSPGREGGRLLDRGRLLKRGV